MTPITSNQVKFERTLAIGQTLLEEIHIPIGGGRTILEKTIYKVTGYHGKRIRLVNEYGTGVSDADLCPVPNVRQWFIVG